AGNYYMKRFAVTGITRDREYDLTPGLPGSRIMWFSANPNGEAEIVKVILKPKARLKSLQIDVDFAQLKPKGRSALGNLVTKNEVHRMSLKERGVSTLGGRDVWFDHDVKRINYEARGEYLGEFQPEDLVLVILDNGEYYTSTFDATNHYEDNILRIEKFRPDRVWTAVLYDADQGYPYLKRFTFEVSSRRQRYLGENPDSRLILLTDTPGAMLRIAFAAPDDVREPMTVDVEEFIAVKSFKAKGKRLTTFNLAGVEELEPKPQPETNEDDCDEQDMTGEDSIDADDTQDINEADENAGEISDEELRDDIIGQQRLF
ncbi:MAG: DNA gyrase/topoisomerase IV subunit A, partial [Muribaculaceae bacterium]|nr:DNA gyrase/topoisomerase IV subunit A [Muribaculaceae bacterium]